MSRSLLTLFSGGGLADLGMRAAGFRTVAAVEHDAAIGACYRVNHPEAALHVARVEDVDYRPYAGVDALWASPSCQSASVANQSGGETEADRSAAAAIVRCLREARPRVVAMENVWGYSRFDSFASILQALTELGYSFRFAHENAASHGVPQTRKRLILRAVLKGRVPPLLPTHCQGGDTGGLFGDECGKSPWVGWYAALSAPEWGPDLLPDLPLSWLPKGRPCPRDSRARECRESEDCRGHWASWQKKRLPAELASLLVGGANTSDEQAGPGVGVSCTGEPTRCVAPNSDRWRALLVDGTDGSAFPAAAPASCVTACLHRKTGRPRALLVTEQYRQSNVSLSEDRTPQTFPPGEPSPTVLSGHKGVFRAWLADSAGYADESGARVPVCREAREPSGTILSNHGGRGLRAFLLDGQESGSVSELIIRRGDEPCFTASAGTGARRTVRAYENGRIVRLEPRCLARFQSLPDSFWLPPQPILACKIVGNGVSYLLARAVGLSLLEAL